MEEQQQFKSVDWFKYTKITFGVILGWSFWFCLLIIALRWINPPVTSFMLQQNWKELEQERYNLRETWVQGEKLPDYMKLAVIASEDQRFRQHWGLDLAAIDKALDEKKRTGRIRGASTITQQVAKNLFLSPAQTYLRKGIEAVIAVLLEVFWTKDRILEVYLNIAEFGPAKYGIARGADFYYGKAPDELTPKEAARMATVLPNPWRIEPTPASEYVVKRSEWILRNMQQLSGIRYLPKPEPKPDTTDTLQQQPVFLDSLELVSLQDSMELYLDSILIDLELENLEN
ncbi:MAG: monofunctional biosynthetic peptidoglycan transglycosylase [Balneola sp.]|jgi:monofunctional biosynthetic peptidoglycan transglycosylase|nr:monofunctional biosynthetic peptidoglycan transglycosylase [Balneola sp.]MBE79277.1 monofunctional biosynthetic peptidoglycan transglycosylase [Balneola sp.]|tara:strand:+ start:988 stop:1848 length:861 start_codon:yes stop_codon:yes gene_type:complete